MTKLRNIEDLQQRLDDELAWRTKELIFVKSLIPAKASSKILATEKENYYIRSGIALLYAHWEGFIKAAGNIYLEYVTSQKLQYLELANNFLALAAKKHLNDLDTSSKITAHVSVTKFFLHGLAQRCSYLPEIETKSNLPSEVLEEIVSLLGLDYKEYETKANLIDAATFVSLHGTIIELMHLFANQISNAASTQAYKRVPNSVAMTTK